MLISTVLFEIGQRGRVLRMTEGDSSQPKEVVNLMRGRDGGRVHQLDSYSHEVVVAKVHGMGFSPVRE